MMHTKRTASLFAAGALGLVVALAGCGASSASGGAGKASATIAEGTPATAQEVLQRATQHPPKDAAFDITLDQSANGQAVHAKGNGKATSSPTRSDVRFSVQGGQGTLQTITDGATIYSRLNDQGKWRKTTVSTGATAIGGTNYLNYEQIKNAHLVGTETVNGVKAYHVKGSGPDGATPGTSATPSVTAAVDLWIRADTYYPLKALAHAAQGQNAVDSTITFTAWDTGATIAPPPADQVTTQGIGNP